MHIILVKGYQYKEWWFIRLMTKRHMEVMTSGLGYNFNRTILPINTIKYIFPNVPPSFELG